MKPAVLGIDAGSRTLKEADHLLVGLPGRLGLPEDVVGYTHLISGRPHVAVSLSLPYEVVPAGGGAASDRAARDLLDRLPDDIGAALGEHVRGPADQAEAASLAAAEHGRSGRAVLFPGAQRLTGTLTAGEVLGRSAIERIVVLMGEEPSADVLVDTRDHVRPEWREGRLTLLALPAGKGVIAPYEVPNPTPCCAVHA
ncbi:hypothetical protein [Actinomadura alba]|uniref:Uncharacterized protein n=1 Tax=Actinomadura alba TaxID=406431 RepID=A0ABR7LVQ9_9ACTN|nr:hypothetical protein [Actinomadura alba]MBC6468937.1 hypothetical protein [Actinomadura alba]